MSKYAHRHIVFVQLPLGYAYARAVLRGVRQYVRDHRPWRVHQVVPRTPQAEAAARNANVIGMIGMWAGPSEWFDPAAAGLPFVNVSGRVPPPWPPSVLPDSRAIGRLAAEYFLNRGFCSFVHAGIDAAFATERAAGFTEAVEAAGQPCGPLPDGPPPGWQPLLDLPRPTALFATTDDRALKLLSTCRVAGVRVPEDLAVLGVDNDETLCDLAETPLSSIDPAGERVGYEAGRLLDRLIEGQPPPEQPFLVQPAGVVTRASTDLIAVEDPDVATAAAYIRAHACDPMSITQMMPHIGVSRRTLEKRFAATFGRTLHDEVRRQQFARARRLLAESDLRIPDVARRSGFNDPKRFTNLFTAAFGQPPSRYREASRSR